MSALSPKPTVLFSIYQNNNGPSDAHGWWLMRRSTQRSSILYERLSDLFWHQEAEFWGFHRPEVHIVCFGTSIGKSILPVHKTLTGIRQGTFHPLYFLDQTLSAEFLPKISKLSWRWKLTSIGLIWHPDKLIESYKKCP